MNPQKTSGGTHYRTGDMKERGTSKSAKYNIALFQVHTKGKASACSTKKDIAALKFYPIALYQSDSSLDTFDQTRN